MMIYLKVCVLICTIGNDIGNIEISKSFREKCAVFENSMRFENDQSSIQNASSIGSRFNNMKSLE